MSDSTDVRKVHTNVVAHIGPASGVDRKDDLAKHPEMIENKTSWQAYAFGALIALGILIMLIVIFTPTSAFAITPGDAWSGDLPWPGGPIFHDAADCSWWLR